MHGWKRRNRGYKMATTKVTVLNGLDLDSGLKWKVVKQRPYSRSLEVQLWDNGELMGTYDVDVVLCSWDWWIKFRINIAKRKLWQEYKRMKNHST